MYKGLCIIDSGNSVRKVTMNRVIFKAIYFLTFLVIADLHIVAGQRWPKRQQKEFKMQLNRDFDVVDLDEYLKNDRLLTYQLKCLLFDQYCDIVGRWLSPRMPKLLLGECPMCTPVQEAKLPAILKYMKTEKEEIYDLLYQKYVLKDKWEEEGSAMIEDILNGTTS